MDELVKIVAQKTGLPEETERQATEVVLEVLKDKLPAPLAGQIDGLLSGEGGPDLGGIAQGLGGMLG